MNISGNATVSLTEGASLVIGNRLVLSSGTSGSGIVTQTGGTLTVDGTSHLYLSGSGNGVYNLDGGTLQIGGTSLVSTYNNLGGTPTFNFGNGTIQVIGSALTSAVAATLTAGSHATIGHQRPGRNLERRPVGRRRAGQVRRRTLTLSGTNTYTGGTAVNAGTLSVSSNANLATAARWPWPTARRWPSRPPTPTAMPSRCRATRPSVSQPADGDAECRDRQRQRSRHPGQAGDGTLILSGINTYTGGTAVNAGTLSISSDANLGNGGTVALANGTRLAFTAANTYSHALTLSGNSTLDVATGQTARQSAAIADGSSPGTLVKTGTGNLTLSGTNTYTGGTAVNAGSLSISSDANLATAGRWPWPTARC